jgi:hypothetical protein
LGCPTQRFQMENQEVWQTISRIRQGADLNGTGTPTISSEKNQEVKLKN